MKKIVLLLSFLLIILLVAGCLEYDIKTVNAQVYDKVYKHDWTEIYQDDDPTYETYYTGTGKYRTSHTRTFHHYHMDTRYHPAQYWVYFKFEDMTDSTNDEELYRSVEKGSSIKASIHEGYDDSGKMVDHFLTTWVTPTEDKQRKVLKGLKY